MGIETPKYGPQAAGNEGDVQINSGNELAADEDFNWDSSTDELSLSDLTLKGAKGSIAILDNQTVPLNIITLPTGQVKNAVIEYSIERATERRIGQLLVTHNGITSTLTDISTDTGGTGIADTEISFSSQLSGTDLFVRYISSSTGSSGSFKYSIRKWN